MCCAIKTKKQLKQTKTVPKKAQREKEQEKDFRKKITPVGATFFAPRPDRPWGPPSLLYTVYRVSLLGVKRPGRGVNHPPHLKLRLKKE